MTLPPLIEVIRKHGLDAKKSLGQNFLLDRRITDRIAVAAGRLDGVEVVEVGPGPGGLTRSLLEAGAKRVVAVERDDRCVAALAELQSVFPDRLTIVPGNALEENPAKFIAAPRRIIANLPYNIATPLLIAWLKEINAYDALVLMFQKEVAQRLTAVPRSKNYGRLSVLTQWLAAPETVFDLPPGAFMPPPKVTSTVVLLHPRETPLAPASMPYLEKVTAAAFGQRRKMLRASLKTLGLDVEALLSAEDVIAAGVVPTARAEELDVPAFCALARTVEAMEKAAGR